MTLAWASQAKYPVSAFYFFKCCGRRKRLIPNKRLKQEGDHEKRILPLFFASQYFYFSPYTHPWRPTWLCSISEEAKGKSVSHFDAQTWQSHTRRADGYRRKQTTEYHFSKRPPCLYFFIPSTTHDDGWVGLEGTKSEGRKFIVARLFAAKTMVEKWFYQTLGGIIVADYKMSIELSKHVSLCHVNREQRDIY